MSVAVSDGSAVVDAPAAAELMTEIRAKLDGGDLAHMSRTLEAKAAWARATLEQVEHAGAGAEVDASVLALLRSFFPSRRRARAMLDALGGAELARAMGGLVWGGGELAGRVGAFEATLAAFPEVTVDLTWELLHLLAPERYWLWTRWMWNPRTETGALRLVTVDDVDLGVGDRLEVYARVGAALALVDRTARAMRLVDDSPYGVDVFLACVYGIYMYTVLRMRMSQEFNRIVPELPSLARRLLGIAHLEEELCR